MSDETRAKLLRKASIYQRCDDALICAHEVEKALTAHEQAVAAEAVLAFAQWARADLGIWDYLGRYDAERFIQSQGWPVP